MKGYLCLLHTCVILTTIITLNSSAIIFDNMSAAEIKAFLREGLSNDNRAAVTEKDYVGRTWLHYAAIYGEDNAIHQLIEQGAVIDQKDQDGDTALLCAIKSDESGAVKVLIQHGACVLEPDRFGQTCLHHAAIVGNIDIIKEVLRKGSCPKKTDIFGLKPLEYAHAYNKAAAHVLEVLEKLIDLHEHKTYRWTVPPLLSR